MFRKILIANRGEIAVRIIRACRDMGIQTVAVYSDIDKDSLHVQLADESICIGSKFAHDSYLNMERILSAALITGTDAIHPGFGFLSENSRFALLCQKCNITFIGPSSEVIKRMGDKAEARKTMMDEDIPVVPGTKEPLHKAEDGIAIAREIGFPVMVKASAGGGGKGLRIIEKEEDFIRLFENARLEAKNAFSDDTMYVEKYLEGARHIEFQIIADKYGNVLHLGERDCSMQRRHQKILEEAPSSALSEELRAKMGETAVRAAKAANYCNAGTIEFILDKYNNFYFIEMNTRIQVEHAVTEMITGIDIVKEQIKIAAGEKLSYLQDDIEIKGHAIECRINAEDAKNNFMPCAGEIKCFHMPGGNGVRVDSALYMGYKIPPFYDSLIANLIVYDKDRKSAIMKMRNALGEFVIDGISTNLDFQYDLINDENFKQGNFDTNYIEKLIQKKSNH